MLGIRVVLAMFCKGFTMLRIRVKIFGVEDWVGFLSMQRIAVGFLSSLRTCLKDSVFSLIGILYKYDIVICI